MHNIMHNILAFIRNLRDAKAERRAQELLAKEDAIMAQRLAEHRLANRQRMARTAMGTNAISHPDYKSNKRYSNDDSTYTHFRAQYLESVRDAAELARSDNPAHCEPAARLRRL